MEKSLTIQSNCISRLSVEEIRLWQEKNKSLIVPLGGLEPFGTMGATGIPGICAEALAQALARAYGSLVAPLIPFASSPVFKAFPGCVSIGSRGYENIILNLCESWNYQGFEKILLINSAFMPDRALEMALKRLEKLHGKGEVRLYSWQNDTRVKEMIRNETDFSVLDRFEYARLSMALHIDRESVRNVQVGWSGAGATKEDYNRWKKRGADPEKYRKLFKDGVSSPCTESGIDIDLGKKIFGYILKRMVENYSSFLQTDSSNVA